MLNRQFLFAFLFLLVSFQIFACDISVADYKVQVAAGYILPTLYTLNLQKEGSIFPSALQKRIDEAKDSLTDNKLNQDMFIVLKSIERLVDECQLYEVDIKYQIINN